MVCTRTSLSSSVWLRIAFDKIESRPYSPTGGLSRDRVYKRPASPPRLLGALAKGDQSPTCVREEKRPKCPLLRAPWRAEAGLGPLCSCRAPQQVLERVPIEFLRDDTRVALQGAQYPNERRFESETPSGEESMLPPLKLALHAETSVELQMSRCQAVARTSKQGIAPMERGAKAPPVTSFQKILEAVTRTSARAANPS